MRLRVPAIVLILVSVPIAVSAAEPGPRDLPENAFVMPLWEGEAPGAVGSDPDDIPTLTVYKADPATSTGAAFVICPGGGYGGHAMNHEGHEVARWLNSIGITGAIVKYRLGSKYRHPIPLTDAQRAIRTVRANAEEWGISPDRVGIIGFSAGGHLASTTGTHFDEGDPEADDPIDRQSSRPDLMVLGYPVIAMATEYTHLGSRRNLLGENPPRDLLESLSNERMVTPETPPAFIVQTNEDKAVPAENSLLFVLAMRKAGVPVEYHHFEIGPHGLGLGTGSVDHGIAPDPAFSTWPGLCETWLKRRGFLDNDQD